MFELTEEKNYWMLVSVMKVHPNHAESEVLVLKLSDDVVNDGIYGDFDGPFIHDTCVEFEWKPEMPEGFFKLTLEPMKDENGMVMSAKVTKVSCHYVIPEGSLE